MTHYNDLRTRLDDAVRLRNVENLLAKWEREADDA